MDKNYSVLMSVYYKENPKWFRESIESILNIVKNIQIYLV